MRLGRYDLHPGPRELFLKTFQCNSSTGGEVVEVLCYKALDAWWSVRKVKGEVDELLISS